jgi:flagellar motor switch protein FliN
MDGMLSQEEINALLAGVDNGGGNNDSSAADTTSPEDDGQFLTEEQKDAIGEISNISMGSAATTLGMLLNQTVTITTPNVSYVSWEELSDSYDRPCVFLQIKYVEGLDGNNVLVLKENDVKIITDLMMGGPGVASDEPITDLHLSAIGEAMNQMMGSASTSMSSMLNKKIDISPPIAEVIDLNESMNTKKLPEFLKSKFVKVSFKMLIGDLIDSEIMQLYPVEFAKSLYEIFGMHTSDSDESTATQAEASQPAPAPQPAPQSAPAPQPAPVPQPNTGYAPDMNGYQQPGMNPYAQPMGGYMQPAMPYPQPQVMGGYQPQQMPNVQPASFQPFTGNVGANGQPENIGLIMDVPLEVTVELGRTKKSIKEILDFAPGTIVELNKIAGEPVDVLVNGKYVAKGEVVVIEESFGIKITEIIK